MLMWDPNEFNKKDVGTRYVELLFWHPLGSAVLVVHPGASGTRNINAQFFCDRVGRCGFHKKRGGTHYSELVLLHLVRFVGHVVHSGAYGRKTSVHYFLCSGGTGVDWTKTCQDTLC
jgi:hypothetical protein